MSSIYDKKTILPRYRIIAYLFGLIGFAIVAKATYTAAFERDYWMEVASRLKKDSVYVNPTRGNILSSDGRLMAGTLPEYKLYIDCTVRNKEVDSLWMVKRDSICRVLSRLLPDKSFEEFRERFKEGDKAKSRHWLIYPKRVSYNVYSEVKSLPVFSLPSYRGGFHVERFIARKRPFGSLAHRTIGDFFGEMDSARCGLELSFDTILRGKRGIESRRRVGRKYLSIIEKEPEDGCDILTTIDVNIQDLAERAVIDELNEINGNVGVAIVMEVSTGDIKAIVNMSRLNNGGYGEVKNNAVNDLLEPGSVFKTASLMVALDDGVVDTTYMVDTGCGKWDMYGAVMRDHNWTHGGYQTISLPRTLEVSSNIGVSRIIDRFYSRNPEKFVEGINRLGLTADLKTPIPGASNARVRMPKRNARGQYTNWSATTLPWMSIGYETQVPPLSTLTFYNAIANNGKMVRPRLVKAVMKKGEVVREYPVEVIRQNIAKASTVKTMQTILEHVVSQGLGRKAGSPSFKVAGKTGTAQISQGKGGYKQGRVNYLLSFAGYFPADNPRYSCIVCLQKTGLPASGGGMSGVVFHNISEGVMAQNIKTEASGARDVVPFLVPEVKDGNLRAADCVLKNIGVKTTRSWEGAQKSGFSPWGKAQHTRQKVSLTEMTVTKGKIVPDVERMGARDAVYLLESRGVRVTLQGRGKVRSQSLKAGTKIRKGMVCTLVLG